MQINNQGNADARNTEYCGEACKIYFAKHRVCFSLHPEPCILLLTKGKLGVVVINTFSILDGFETLATLGKFLK